MPVLHRLWNIACHCHDFCARLQLLRRRWRGAVRCRGGITPEFTVWIGVGWNDGLEGGCDCADLGTWHDPNSATTQTEASWDMAAAACRR